jgi:hypothetical protein
MEARTLDRMTTWITGAAIPIVLASLLASVDTAIGAAAGAALAVINWRVIRGIAGAVVRANDAARARMMLLLVGKTGLVLALVALFVRVFDATGLLLGVSAMVIGVLGGAIHTHVVDRDRDLVAEGED